MGDSLNGAWTEALGARGQLPVLERLLARVAGTRASGVAIAPSVDDIFRAPNLTPPGAVRVVILGQDPYPTPGHADGLCFSVRPGVAIPRSLQNIFRELSTDLDIPRSGHGSLTSWADQGVLLLNTILTVTEGKAGSHASWGWQAVTDAMISIVSEQHNPVVFVLWGRHAQAKIPLIDKKRHKVLESVHPSPLSARRGFFGSRPFSSANSWLWAQGRGQVDWVLPDTPR